MSQRVVFRKFTAGPPDIIAFFLDRPYPRPGYCESYMHEGQHGGATYPHSQTEPASQAEYAALLEELKRIGYNDLRIVKKGRVKS